MIWCMRSSLRRFFLVALIGGLSVAALVAIAAILTESWTDTDLRVVLTSLGFSVFSAVGAAGVRAERGPRALLALGRSTIVAAIVSFVALVFALWIDHGEVAWRAFGTVALISLACSHAALVLSSSRSADSQFVTMLVSMSVAAGTLDTALGVLPLVGATDGVSDAYVRLLAVILVVTMLTSILPPLLRRLALTRSGRATIVPSLDRSTSVADQQAFELLVMATRLEALAAAGGDAATEIRQEAQRLQEIAASLQR